MSQRWSPEELSQTELALRAAFDQGDFSRVTTLALRSYGEEVFGFMRRLLRDDGAVDEAFGMFAEDLWRGIPQFGWRASFRTWAYTLARHAVLRQSRRERRMREVPLDDQVGAELFAVLKTTTAVWLKTETKERFAQIRAQLTPEEDALLALRADRELSWLEIAAVMGDTGAALDEEAARLRKRYQRLKAKLRELGAQAGVLRQRS